MMYKVFIANVHLSSMENPMVKGLITAIFHLNGLFIFLRNRTVQTSAHYQKTIMGMLAWFLSPRSLQASALSDSIRGSSSIVEVTHQSASVPMIR